ncbi:MAG TPA: NAD(P)/FAD-dependent oxidoreductase, partial [Acidimicrobiales bacterium]|nr:NAD(P)/FAD-dependent oxidoreductase [Acidimicrobiales bacterium]
HPGHELGRQVLGLDEAEEGDLRVRRRDHGVRPQRLAALEDDPDRLAVLHEDAGDGGVGADDGAERLGSAARSFGVEIRTEAAVEHITVRNGAVTGVVLEGGTELRAPLVLTTVHPKLAFLQLLDRRDLPADFVDDIERWHTRSGTVKINVAVDRLPEFSAKPGYDPEVHGGTIVLARSLDEVEGAFQDAVAGRPASRPFADICIPSVFDRTLAPEGRHIVSMFTQWVPHGWAASPRPSELESYADTVVATMEEVAPGFTDSIVHRTVIGPYEMEQTYGLVGGNIFHGELSPSQLFHMRPAPGWANFRTPIAGLYQAGSATHGGGGVSGIPALNAVRQIERDERRRRWRRRNVRPDAEPRL